MNPNNHSPTICIYIYMCVCVYMQPAFASALASSPSLPHPVSKCAVHSILCNYFVYATSSTKILHMRTASHVLSYFVEFRRRSHGVSPTPQDHLLPAPPCSHETHQCSKGHCRPESKPQPLKQTLQTDLAQQRLSILQLMRNSQRRTRLKRMLREWPFPNFPNEEVTLSSY